MNRNLKQPDLSTAMTSTSSKRQPSGWLPTSLRGLFTLLMCWVFLISSTLAATVEVTYIHTDTSGSPMAATDAAGNILWRESYRGYGERWMNQAASAKQTQWFHGKELDATGMQYFGARYYDPEIGRFTGIDPVGFQQENAHTFNRYAYGANNPIKFSDPDGKAFWFAFVALLPLLELSMFAQSGGEGPIGLGAAGAAGAAGKAAQVGHKLTPVAEAIEHGAATGAYKLVTPNIGDKLQYFLGKATGNSHNIERSTGMLRQLESIGLHDNPATRKYLTDHLTSVANNPLNIVKRQENGRIVRDSLVTGPNGSMKFETIWEGDKLITGTFLGGR